MSDPVGDVSLMAVWRDASSAHPWFSELLWSAIGYAFGFALAGLVLAGLAMALFHRRRWLRRVHRGWNVGAKLSYLVILVVLPLAGALGGILLSLQQGADRLVDRTLVPQLADSMPQIRDAMAAQLGPQAGNAFVTARDLVQPLVEDIMYRPADDTFVERSKARIFNGLIVRAAAMAMTEAIQRALALLPEVVSERGGTAQDALARFSVRTVAAALSSTAQHVDFSELDRTVPEMFGDAMHGQIRSVFMGFYLGLAIKLLLVGLLIGAELFAYYKYYLPRRVGMVAAVP